MEMLEIIKLGKSRVDVDFIKTTYDISLVFLHFFVTFRILSTFISFIYFVMAG